MLPTALSSGKVRAKRRLPMIGKLNRNGSVRATSAENRDFLALGAAGMDIHGARPSPSEQRRGNACNIGGAQDDLTGAGTQPDGRRVVVQGAWPSPGKVRTPTAGHDRKRRQPGLRERGG